MWLIILVSCDCPAYKDWGIISTVDLPVLELEQFQPIQLIFLFSLVLQCEIGLSIFQFNCILKRGYLIS